MKPRMMTELDSLFSLPLAELRRRLLPYFADFESPAAERDWLLHHYLKVNRTAPWTSPGLTLDEPLQRKGSAALRQRLDRAPWAYIAGGAEFGGRFFEVGPGCLVPREDSLPMTLAFARLLPSGGRFFDWGTGSGCLALTVARERPDCRGFALEAEGRALTWAWRNRRRMNLEGRVRLWHGSRASDLPAWRGEGLISNPPYIPSHDVEQLMPDVRCHEPWRALDGGRDGLDLYPAIIAYAAAALRTRGILALEFGDEGQGERIDALAAASGFERLRWGTDLAGLRRFGLWILSPWREI